MSQVEYPFTDGQKHIVDKHLKDREWLTNAYDTLSILIQPLKNKKDPESLALLMGYQEQLNYIGSILNLKPHHVSFKLPLVIQA